MGRVYSKNTSNYTAIGINKIEPRLNAAQQITIAGWFYPTSLTTGAADNTIFHGYCNAASTGLQLYIGGASSLPGARGRSVAADAIQTSNTGVTTITTGKWWHIGCTFDFVAKTIQLYLNGVTEGSAFAATWANASYTPATPTSTSFVGTQGSVAVPAGTGQQLAGYLADVAVWYAALNPLQWALLADGERPKKLHPNELAAYWPLDTSGNQIADEGWYGRRLAVTGSIGIAPDPPRAGRFMRKRRPFGIPPGAAIVAKKPLLVPQAIQRAAYY